jgi:predicted nucleic acid-binding protein
MTIRAVLDTNVVLSGLLWHGTPHALLDRVREGTLVEVRELTEVIAPPPLAEPVCRDPDDDAMLALGVAASVDLIVSGDKDLLTLKSFQGIAIVTPADALRLVDTE